MIHKYEKIILSTTIIVNVLWNFFYSRLYYINNYNLPEPSDFTSDFIIPYDNIHFNSLEFMYKAEFIYLVFFVVLIIYVFRFILKNNLITFLLMLLIIFNALATYNIGTEWNSINNPIYKLFLAGFYGLEIVPTVIFLAFVAITVRSIWKCK